MDFALTEELQEVADLGNRIFDDLSTHERLKAVESAGESIDAELWKALADAGLLAVALAEDLGGAGLGFLATAVLLEAAGKHAARVPLVETLAYAAPAIARHGTTTQKERWLGGSAVLTAALSEPAGGLVLEQTEVTKATQAAGGTWTIDGSKSCVPAGMIAEALLVPARRPDGSIGVFLVEGTSAGLSRTAQEGPFAQEAGIVFAGVAAEEVGGEEVIATIRTHAVAGLCLLQAGVAAAAVALVGEYTKTREQFDKPIATFQAVGQRAADAYVDAEAIRLTAWQVAWRLAEGLDAESEGAIAKYWAAEGGQRVVHAAVHLHGGVGVDRDYPLHRHFLLTRQIELTLGGARESLARLGTQLAATAV